MPSEKKKRVLPPPIGLEVSVPPKDSLVEDLRNALEHSRELFSDIAWEFTLAPTPTTIYAHKAILYARSSRSFKERFMKYKDSNGQSIRSVRLSNPDPITVKTDADPFLFKQELKFFYTGEEGSEEFLNAVDTTDELEQQKLKEDLLYMYKSKLYTDVESEYFKKMLSSNFLEARTASISLDATIFSPMSINLILSFIYTGNLTYNQKPLTLEICEWVWIGADFLNMKNLCDDIVYRISTKVHYFACTCGECQVVIPRVASFAKEHEVTKLWKGCLHVLAIGFDNMWPHREFANLDEDTREEVLMTLLANIQTSNIISIFKGCRRIYSMIDIKGIGLPWIESIRRMTNQVRSFATQILVDDFEQICEEDQEFLDCVDGVGFSLDILEDIMNIIVEEGLTEQNSTKVLKCITEKLLTRPAVVDSEITESKAVLLRAKQNVFDYIKKRWIGIKQYGGFRLLSPMILDEFEKELGVDRQELQAYDENSKPKTTKSPNLINGKNGTTVTILNTNGHTKKVVSSITPSSSSSSLNSNRLPLAESSSVKSNNNNSNNTSTKRPSTKKGKSVRIGETTTWDRPTRASVLRQKALAEAAAKNPVKNPVKILAKTATSTNNNNKTTKKSPSTSSLKVPPAGGSSTQRGRSPNKQTSSRPCSSTSINSVATSISPARLNDVRQNRASMLRQLKYDDAHQRRGRGRDRDRNYSPKSSRASSIASASSATSSTTTSSHHRRKRSPSINSTSTTITNNSNGKITSLQPKSHQTKLATTPNPDISVGRRVILPTKNNAPGIIQFLGETEFAKGIWVGIELDNAASIKYFAAANNHGIFVRPDSLLLIC
ncbi:7342_t:CDS:2 [Diversispora eburnea]|uniref:7342_t:CDS:1 n=1 Tax=Diversispora eburnea TaxID=1213867 RepID=A0A9N8YJK7_9GLOM|nr:7342_t:CDS:2 [Diversispora eburnea]